MNHIYKVVWSKVRGCYVVVAEIARSNGKTRSQKVVAVLGTALISSMLFTGGGLLTAEAAQGQAFGDSTTASGANSIAAGNTTTASGQESIALGTHNTASGKWSVAFGGTSIQQTFRNHGKNYFVYQIGDKTYYKNENDYFSTEDNMKFTGDASTATAVMVNAGNTASGDASVAFGQNTQAKSLGSVAFGMGTQAGAEDGKGGQNSIAFGNYTKALGGRSVAFGEYTIANYNDSVAFGNDTRALSTGATAFGNRTRALSSYSTAWGNATVAADEESTAWGSDTIAGAKLDDNGAVTNIYTYKNNPDDKNEQPKTATEKMDVHGNLAYTQNGSTVGVRQMDIGGNTEKHDYVVLDGQDGNTYVRDYQGSLWRVTVSADGKTATVDTTVGDNGKVYNNNSKAGTVGSKATTTVNGTEVAITPDSVLKKAHEGSNGYNIDGYKDATAFGYSTEASGDYATAFGNDTQAKATGATTFGTTTKASGDNATAFGLSSTASGKQATAFGSSSTASGDNATAFGESSTASGEASTAFGISSTASGRNSLAALGGTASAENAAAIGNGAQATLIDSVALGSNSKTTRAKYSALTDAKEKAAYAKGSTSTGSAWEATDNAIAVGNDSTTTRQITGVAAGSLDTDAVNVAQLRAVDAKHTIVTVGGNSVTADNTPVNGGNLDLKRTTATNGQETYDLSLDKNVILGEQVENNGGKLTVNNVDKFKNYDKDGKPLPDTTVKEAVKIDGKTVSVVKHDGSAADNDQRQVVLGVDQDAGGYVALYDNTGRKPTYIYNAISGGITYLKDKNSYLTPDLTNPNDERASNEFNRLEYGDYHTGTIQFIATLDDGQKYAGDNYEAAKTETKTVDGKTTTTVTKEEQNVLLKKLNERLDIKGGATGVLTDNNIGVNVKDGLMKVQLAQNINLGDKGSVEMGDTTINNGGVTINQNGDKNNPISLTKDGLNNGGKTITNVGNGTKDSDAVNVSQLNAAKTTVTSNDHSVTVTSDNNATDKHTNYDLKIATATLSSETTGSGDSAVATGKVAVTNPTYTENGQTVENKNAYVTGQSVADAINKSGFKLTASASEGAVAGNKETLIHPGDTVTIDAGKNISLTQTDGKISIATKDKLVLGKDTSDGKDGQEGTIGLTGKDGVPDTDGKQGYSTTIIKTEKGQPGANGQNGKTGVDGTDITRIVYQNGKDGEVGTTTHTVATLDDGLKFVGNDGKEVIRKLNTTLPIKGGITDANALKNASSKNLGVRQNEKADGKEDGLEVVMTDTPDFTKVTVGEGTDMTQKIIIGKQTVTGKKSDGSASATSQTGNYITGLGNKAWDKDNVVENRAATEGQLRDAINSVNGSVDKGFGLADEAGATVTKKLGDTVKVKGDTVYNADGTVAKDGNIKTTVKDGAIQISLNDQISVGQNGKDGKVTVETKGGTTVVVGRNGADGDNGKDGLFVIGKDGKDGKSGVSITGPDGIAGKDGVDGKVGIAGEDGKDAVSISGTGGVGHIGLTGPKGEKGADGTPGKDGISIDITTDLKSATLDDGKNVKTVIKDKDDKETTIIQAPRIQYDSNGKNYEVATMDDGLKIGANAAALGKTANPVSNKLNSTINIMGSAAKAGHTYTDDNLTTTVKKDENGNTTVKVLMDKDITGNSVTVGEKGEKGESGTPGKDGVDGTIGVNGKDGSSVVIKGQDGISINGKDGQNGVTIKGVDGKAGTEGHIGLIGPKGPKGADGKDGQNASADIHVKNGQVGVDGTDGNKGTNGMDRVVYEDHNHVTHEVATMGDGLKFAGDDAHTTVAKKLNETLQIRGDGTYDEKKNTVADDGNIKTSVDNGAVKVSLSDKINLHQDGYLTVGGSKNGNAADGNDPIVIKHFDDKTLDVITGVDKKGKPIIAKEGKAGDYVTGLDNKDWNVDKPEYVSGRAATEDQLKTISDAVKEAATTAGKHTVITVENGKAAGTTDYNGENLKLKVTDEDGQKTYDLKLNDKVTLGKDGVDGTVGLKGADGKSSIGLNGKDGISVIGTDGKNGVSITGSNGLNGENGIDGKIAIGTPGKDGQPGKDAVSISGKDGVGHIGLTGQKGADGKDGAFTDLSTILGTATLDRNQNEVKDKDSTKDKASRIQYQTTVTTEDGKTKTITHEVATMDDGLKFVGNDGKEVAKKLNSTLSLTGGMDKDAVATASSKNLGVRSNTNGDGLELVMTNTPDFTKVTVGEGTDTTQKIIIGKQTVTGKKSDGTAGTAETGKYITGLDNTKWNKDNVVENRAATEGQLRDVAGSITNQSQGGGFGLADEARNTVKKDLGQTVTVKGDGKNIETKVVNGSLEVSLKKDVDLGGNGSINAGQTKVDQNGVDTNKVTIKDSGISISKDGINGGGKQITNIASGIDGKTYADAKDNNAASIGDVKNIAGKVEQNVTNVTNNVNQIGQHVDKLQTDVTQLQQDVKADRQYQGDDAATKKSVNVKFGRFLSLTGGAKVEALADEGNLGVIQQEKEDPDNKGEKLTGLSIRLAKDLKGLNSVEANTVNAKTVNSETFQAGNTTINNGGLTVKGDDKHKDITVQQGSVNMGGNKIEGVAPGKVAPDSTEAINGSQLAQRDQAIGKLGGEVSSLDRRVDRVGAGAAALAALHPQDFDPDDKWDFAVGYGNYRGANAAAVGAFYRPNEDTTLSVGGTVGGGENMVNAGISFKFGQGNHVTNSRVAMAKELLALKDYVQKQDEKIEQLEALVGKQGTAAAPKRRSILFPDVPENHWAYAYVKKLADRGLLEGYPDGEFKGDRTITRYEFAAIFSRALENGASVDTDMERMSEEFEPEIRELSLNRFRVDRVEGKDNDRHKIERVRVNDRDELVKQKNGEQKKRYRDVYGSVIEKDAPADAAK
ncbi:ESPR-type extended signal peptide-containing protein [Mitsuokella multacida]|uniref:SLH domain-containing protein n=1 Tax=Mitsuokella multacida DSM 20544 TaxID=500635 RepID=C9KKU3_9FIRM|nr:ESPR-type extended signal peptide-containing protein [Mitsuokella multacida]EEX69743.1 hypothetical protein MITSMUL_03793 [Mitsuokella multacida DSM 20544]